MVSLGAGRRGAAEAPPAGAMKHRVSVTRKTIPCPRVVENFTGNQERRRFHGKRVGRWRHVLYTVYRQLAECSNLRNGLLRRWKSAAVLRSAKNHAQVLWRWALLRSPCTPERSGQRLPPPPCIMPPPPGPMPMPPPRAGGSSGNVMPRAFARSCMRW